MRVCLLANKLDRKSGGGRFAYDFVEQMKKTDPSIELVVLTTEVSGYEKAVPLLYSKPIKLAMALPKIRKIISSCDIVHALDVFPYGIIATIATLGMRKKVIITAVGTGSVKPLYQRRYRMLSKWAYKKANQITSISRHTAYEVHRVLPTLPMLVINPGINEAYFHIKASLSEEVEISQKQPFIMSAGLLKERKGQLDCVKAFVKVLEHVPDLHYVIVGTGRGEYYKKICAYLEEKGALDRVTFKKDISDEEIAGLYTKASVFVLMPQDVDHDFEGFGLVFLEAASFGLPVIGTKNSGAEDAILDGENGYLINPGDSDAMAKHIVSLVKDGDTWKRFSESSKAFAKSKNLRYSVGQYIHLYKSL